MRVAEFLENFRYVAEAPNGVARLRELVLQLAVSGRLVEQDPAEGSGSNAIMVAEQGRLDYQSEFGLRRCKLRGQIRDDEKFFVIPDSWQWARMERIACYIQRGKGPSYAIQGQVRVVSQKCVQWSGFDLSPARYVSDESLGRYADERFLAAGDILWNSTGTGTAGRVAVFPIVDARAVADSHVTVIRLTNFSPRFVWCYLASPSVQQRVLPGLDSSLVSGTTNQVELSTTKVLELPIPCPPIAEQQRIVAKVDELMALCDKLESQHQDRERRFSIASHACHSRFVQDAPIGDLSLLLQESQAASCDDFRQTILNLSIRGKLTGAEEQEISRTGKQPAQGGEANKLDPSRTTAAVGNLPFSIPNGWQWVKVSEVAETRLGKMLDKQKNKGTQRPYLRNTNVRWFRFDLTDIKTMPFANAETDEYRLQKGDVLVCEGGHGIARSAVWEQELPELMFQKALHRVRPSASLNPYFFVFCLWCYERSGFLRQFYTGAGIPHFTGRAFAKVPLPLPSRGEQDRIVAKADMLVSLVDRLEKLWVQANSVGECFSNAAVNAITSISSQESNSMKAPQTELVTRLTVTSRQDRPPGASEPLAALLAEQDGPLSAKALWQRSGLAINAFYQQLKTEMAAGWIIEPEPAQMRELEAD